MSLRWFQGEMEKENLVLRALLDYGPIIGHPSTRPRVELFIYHAYCIDPNDWVCGSVAYLSGSAARLPGAIPVLFTPDQDWGHIWKLAEADWAPRIGWKQQKNTVFRRYLSPNNQELELDNAVILQHLARAQMLIGSFIAGSDGMEDRLYDSMVVTIGDFIADQNARAAGRYR